MARFQVRAVGTDQGRERYAVVDTDNRDLPVAHFEQRGDADAHAEKLEQGPLDLDEQEAWKDEWDEDDDRGDGA